MPRDITWAEVYHPTLLYLKFTRPFWLSDIKLSDYVQFYCSGFFLVGILMAFLIEKQSPRKDLDAPRMSWVTDLTPAEAQAAIDALAAHKAPLTVREAVEFRKLKLALQAKAEGR
jgi:hypothetical protein